MTSVTGGVDDARPAGTRHRPYVPDDGSGILFVAGSGAARWRRRWASRADAAALAVVIGATCLKAISVYRGYFYCDDWHIQAVIANGDLDLERAFGPYGAHLVPGAWALAAGILATFGPAPWIWWNVVGVLIFALAGTLTWLAVRALVGPHPMAVAALAVPLVGALTLSGTAWGIVWMTTYPVWIASAVALSAQVQLLRTGHLRWFALGLVAVLLGLLFLEKALLIPLEMFLASVFWFARGPLLRSLALILRRLWWQWTTFALLGTSYLTYFLMVSQEQRKSADAFIWIHAFVTVFGQTLPTATTGGPWQWADIGQPLPAPDPPPALLALGVVVVVAVVSASMRYRRDGLRMWAPLATLVVVMTTAIMLARGSAGPDIALTYYYFADLAAFLAATLAVAFLPLRGERDAYVPRVQDAGWRLLRHPVTVLSAIAIFVTGAVWTSNGFAQRWQANQSRPYSENLMTSLAAAPDVELLDSLVDFRTYYWLWPEDVYRRNSQFLRVLPLQPRWVAWTSDLRVIAPDGRIQPGTVDGTAAPPGPRGDCGYLADPDVVIPTGGSPVPWLRVIRLNYLAKSDTDAVVDFGGSRTSIRFARGASEVFVLTEGGGPTIRVTIADAQGAVCISRLVLGDQVPK